MITRQSFSPTIRQLVRLTVLPMLVVFAVSCVTPPLTMETPAGFAAFSDDGQVRAITPEGVLVRARTVPNDPAQSLEFWAEALERHLVESGYQSIEKDAFTTNVGEGVLFEWLAPVSEDDWYYLTAIAILGDQIAVVEAAGPSDQYDRYRPAIRASLESLQIQAPGS